MARNKPKSDPAQLSREAKLKLLKRAKLYEGSTKIVAGKASGAQKRVLSKFRHDIPLLASGRAKSVDISKVPKAKRTTMFAHTAKRALVPVEDKNARVHANKKTGEITVVFKHGARKYRQYFFDPSFDLADLPRIKGATYQVNFNNWASDKTTFKNDDPEESIREMAAFMYPYAHREKNPWVDWVLNVSVLVPVK